jgi:O-antigen biosynthesis protein
VAKGRPTRTGPRLPKHRDAAGEAESAFNHDEVAEIVALERARAPRGRQIILHVDRPIVAGGVALGPARGNLIIEGWALARRGVKSIGISIDGKPVGAPHYGVHRRDIAETFPDWDDAGTSGFVLMAPAAALSKGRRRIEIKLTAKTGETTTTRFWVDVDVEQRSTEDGPLVVRKKMPLSEIQLGFRILSGLGWQPAFGIILGVGEAEEEIAAARRTLASLRDQTYPSWSVAIVRRGRTLPDSAAALIEDFDDIAGQLAFRPNCPADMSLVDAVRMPGMAQPDLIGPLLAGDTLGCDALLEMAIHAAMHPQAQLFYSDEQRIGPSDEQFRPFLKPQWSAELLDSTNYIGRFWCTLPSVLQRARASYGEWFQFGDYDLILRCTEQVDDIRRVPKVLCRRGRAQLDHVDQERAALRRALDRRGRHGEIAEGPVSGSYRWMVPAATSALVSIIIPTCATGGLIKTCIETLRAKTAYRNFEIICVENIPPAEAEWKAWLRERVGTVIAVDGPFNWSRFNNLAAREARGEFLIFLNDDIEITDPGWLDALLAHAVRPEVGVVGARLLYPDRRVQHAGIVWTPNGGRHAFRSFEETDPGYFGLAVLDRNVIAVTGACLLVRRAEFEALGGFDEGHTIVNNDVDFCLRCHERGKSIVYAPRAILIHHELASRHALGDDFDAAAFDRRWSRKLQQGDPFYHPHLTRHGEDFSYDPEPLELVYSSHPLFDRAQIKNILVVKLDHIGDFVTAVPALHRLRQVFPHARLHLLVAPGSVALARTLPGIADIIEYEFFFARSGLGQRALSQEDYTTLRKRLEPYRFDLALDLRKAMETRPLLQLADARWLAGFDHLRRFPWLDIAMEWEQDPSSVRKRNHVGDDLVRLIDAIAHAASPNNSSLPTPAPGGSTDQAGLAGARRLHRRLICVHPGVGSPIRQWPARYFAGLIDLLVAAHNVEIVLIGSPDEAEIAAEVMASVQRPAMVRSLVGALSLSELPGLLATAALFVGNNSGPQHLAAALGVPTVGIHSGTVDAREWGPVGPNAVAIRRNMVCSPCYLSDAKDCWRGLACLTELRPIDVYEICRRLLAVDIDLSARQDNFSGQQVLVSRPSVLGFER